MKAIALGLLLAVSANAATVTGARYVERTDELVVNVNYGGCNLETFKPVWGKCLETYPAQTTVTLQDHEDNCEALATGTVRIPLNGACRPAHVTVRTARNSRSSVSVFVPEIAE